MGQAPVRRGGTKPRAGILASALLAFVIGSGAAFSGAFIKPSVAPEHPEAIVVTATPITRLRPDGDEVRFGALSFRGGLVLKSTDPSFGGISGFTLTSDDRFLAVTDAGAFIAGRLDTDGDRPIGVSDVTIVALKDSTGRVQNLRGRGDAESITLAPDAVYVGLEDVNEIWRYPRDPTGPDPRAQHGVQVRVPAAVRRLRPNLGLESLAYVPSGPLRGALIAVGEDGLVEGADLPGFIIGGKQPGQFTIRKSGPFNATDLAIGPNGDMYLLERHFSLETGLLMQMRRFSLAEVKPGAVLTGTILGTFDADHDIDNMEGLAVTVNADGETLLTLISDNNFSPFQRTVLLRFAVVRD